MSAQHTPGRLVVRPHGGNWSASYEGYGAAAYMGIVSDTGEVVALATAYSPNPFRDPEGPDENARRLVACWNALLDVPTELLERAVSAGITDVSMGNLFSSRMELQAQRDELLAVLHMALPALETMRKQWPRSPLDDSMDVVEVVRAAIAKVEGGAA